MNFMPARPFTAQAAQRALGRLDLAFGASGVQRFYQEGCLKARLPRPAQAGTAEVVTLNISGGVAGGDCLTTSITLLPAARLCLSTQAAERIYHAADTTPARVSTFINLGPGARLDHLPQETILFDGFALDRSLRVNLALDATYLGVESLIFGRQAKGETIRHGSLHDRISITIAGRLALQDNARLEGDIAAQLLRKSVSGGAIAMAGIIYAAPDAPFWLEPVRAVLAASGDDAGASLLQNIIFIRILAGSAHRLRSCVMRVITLLRNEQAMPRAWQG